jgi:branched-chain amino acid transport system permease protein
MDITTFLIQCLNALQYGLLLFLVASGLTLIFGIMGVINLAHGSFYMIGAYMAYALAPLVAATFGGGFFATLFVGLLLAVVLGYLLEWAFFSFLYQREHLQQVLMTYGLILVFEELRSLIVGDDVYGVKPPDWLAGAIPLGEVMTYPVYRLFISLVCLALAAGMWFVFSRTRLGMMIRAGAFNREMVQSLGIDIQFLYRVVFAAGVAIAVLAGMVAAPVSSVYPGMGNQVLIICFVIVVIGGIGSVRGCAAGRAADRPGGHLRQGAAAAGGGRAGVRPDGAHPVVETRRPVQGRLNPMHSPKFLFVAGVFAAAGGLSAGGGPVRHRPGHQDHDLRHPGAQPGAAGGSTGLVCFGQAAFFGIGAYAAVLLGRQAMPRRRCGCCRCAWRRQAPTHWSWAP